MLLSVPWAARVAVAAPLTLLPLFYAYRSGRRAAGVYLTVLFTIVEFLVGLHWIYAGAAAHRGAGEYWTSTIALLFECMPYAVLGLAASWFSELAAPLWCPVIASLWTLCEYWRATSQFGVPYLQLGHALIDTRLVDLARIGGTEALTFACVLGAAVVFELSRRARGIRVAVWAVCALAVAVNIVAFNARQPVAESGDPVTVFQLGEVDDATLPQYISALRALPPVRGFAVWPESDLNVVRGEGLALVRSAVRARRIPLLTGSTVVDASGIHDAIMYLGREGRVKGYYAKRHLVPFGEFLPFPKLAHVLIAATFVDEVPNLSPGLGPVTFTVGDRTVGPLVCYESAFPSLARDEVRMGANLLVAATNDVWFTQPSGLWELAQAARLVALETGTPLLLAGTVGPSGMIDAEGRWTGSVAIGALAHPTFFAPPAHETIYDSLGDVPPLLVLAALVVFAGAVRIAALA